MHADQQRSGRGNSSSAAGAEKIRRSNVEEHATTTLAVASKGREEGGPAATIGAESDGEGEQLPGEFLPSKEQTKWLIMGRKRLEKQTRELEKQLTSAREELAKRDASIRVANEKIRQLEAQSRGLIAAAEVREREASSMQEGASLSEERAHAHERALASALEQLSESGVSQSKKLEEFASVSDELKRTKAALERAERLVFDQRREAAEADERQTDEDRRKAETEGLRQKLHRVERKNTELMARQAAGRLAKKMRGNFGRSSTFCASLCSCFRGRPAYRRVASPSPAPSVPPAGASSRDNSPWLGEETVAIGSLRGL